MEFYNRCIEIIDANLVFCLVPMILTLALFQLLFKGRLRTQKALLVICWFIIGYTAITFAHFIIGMFISPSEFAITQRATGPYWAMYWLMLLSATLLPFTLLIKRLATNYLYVLFVAIAMKIGAYFERFVIIVTSFHRDYEGTMERSHFQDFWIVVGFIFLQGFLLAILLLGCIALWERLRAGNGYSQPDR